MILRQNCRAAVALGLMSVGTGNLTAACCLAIGESVVSAVAFAPFESTGLM